MPLTLEEAISQLKGDVSAKPKYLPLSEAEQIETAESVVNSIPEYSDSPFMRFIKGAYVGFDSLKDTLPSLELYGKTADLAIGGYFGASEETINRKAANIATIQRNLMANQKDRYAYLSKETADSFAFGLGQGAANLLTMYASGGLAGGVAKGVGVTAAKGAAAKTIAGVATGTALENIEQQSERMPINEQGQLEAEKLTPEWAKKSAIGTTAYLSASALLEKYVGFGKQTTLWETPIKFDNTLLKNASVYAKIAAKGAISEGLTEGLQSLTSTGILLAEGTIKMSDMPERLQQAWKEAVIGGILGGSVGTAAAINQQANVKTMLNEEISKVVSDPQEREAIVDAIYDSGTIEMTNVISKELELSSELNTKHGAIYDNMQGAIHKAIQEVGAFAQESEADVAQYVSQTSKLFANQVLAEANKRGCLIDDVLKASDIRYEDGKIKLQAGKEVIAETEVGEVEEVFEPSMFGVADIDTKQNKAIADQIKKNIKDEEQLFREYKKHRSEVFKKYKSIKQLKEQALVAIKDEYGQNSQALNDYQTLVAYENLLNQARYVENNYKPAVLYQSAMLADINPKQKVNVVDLTSNFTTDSSLSKKDLSVFIKSLIGTKINTADKKAILEFVKKSKRIGKKDVYIPEHIAGSSKVESNYKSERNASVANITDLIQNSVLIEKTANNNKNTKPNVDFYLRFYVPVRTNKDNIFTVRLVAENNEKDNFFNIVSGNVYDLIIDKKIMAHSPSTQGNLLEPSSNNIITQPQETSSVEQITIEEMLKDVEDADGNIYYQIKNNPKNPKEDAKGSYIVSEKAIELFKDADYSTLPHEFAHFWLDNMWSYSRSGAASDAYKNNFQALLDFLGVKDSQIYLTRGQQEKFARAYEKYLLNGYAPNGLVQGAFDDYDKWLQRVYNDARELKVKLTADAIEFFDSMTTGKLEPYSVEETNREVIEKEVPKVIKEAKKVAVQAQAVFNGSPITSSTVPVETEGEKAESRAFTRQAEILDIAEELNYDKANIEEQNKKAQGFVKADLARAQRIVTGVEKAPSDILKNAIYNAYLKEMLAIGNTDAYVEALRNQSLELTRMGQEIASQRGAIENIFDSTYWIRRIENRLKEIKAVEKFYVVGENESNAVKKLENYIDTEISKVLDKFVNESAEVQANMVKTLVDKVASELKAKPPEELYQRLREPSEVRTRTNAYNYLYKAVNEGLGLTLNKQQVNEIISKTSDIQKSIENTRDRNGNPSALFFKNMADMENYANSIAPSHALSVLTSTIGRGNMLMSIKSILLNIESNSLNFIAESAIKRISYGSIDKVVNPEVIKEYMQYSKDIYNASGYQVSTMEELDATQRILNEKQITSQGEGIIRKLGRGYEQTIFKYGLGYPDLVFKDLAFVDTANLLASKEANGNAEKATAIFKDAILLQPKTKIGQEIREKAQIDALVATYQNKSALSEAALTVRNALNKWSGKLKLGDALNPFVKTPANVLALGIDYTFGAVYLGNIKTIINDFKSGNISDSTKTSLQKIGRNALGVVVATVLAQFIDDDDYIPDYALLSQGERNLVKAKNGVYNAVKIGDKWVSLDYFGPFAMPLAAVLNAKREKALQDKVFNYLTGAGIQGLKIPVFGNLAETFQTAGRLANQDATKGAEELVNSLVDFTSSRLTPAILSDIAKMTDEYERDTGRSALNRAQAKIPVLREQLPTKVNYATGRAVKTENSASVLFAGARIKTTTKGSVINEIDRLYDANTEKNVTLSSVTKGNGALSRLPESEKPRAEAKFARMYADGVAKLIASSRYRNLEDDKKVKAINKIREKTTDKIKKEYGLGKKRSKK
jgi:hypothetical protein